MHLYHIHNIQVILGFDYTRSFVAALLVLAYYHFMCNFAWFARQRNECGHLLWVVSGGFAVGIWHYVAVIVSVLHEAPNVAKVNVSISGLIWAVAVWFMSMTVKKYRRSFAWIFAHWSYIQEQAVLLVLAPERMSKPPKLVRVENLQRGH